MQLKVYMLRAAMPLLRLYWSVWHPKTYGAKVVLFHPEDSSYILLVRHTYRLQNMWTLPGGGYRPSRELPQDAARREIQEELGVSVHDINYLTEHYSTAEGKRDTITVFRGTLPKSSEIVLSAEIAEITWVSYTEAERMENLYEIARESIASIAENNKTSTSSEMST